MNKVVEDLIVYKQYMEFIYYIEMITEKYPKSEKLSLAVNIKNSVYVGLRCIISAYKEYEKSGKLKHLHQLDVELKLLKVYVRISYQKKLITNKNYIAWIKKITNISNLLGGWIRSCQNR